MSTTKQLIKDKLNYIIIGILILVNVFLTLFSVSGGVGLNDLPTGTLEWLFWIIGVFAPPTIGIFILKQFRAEAYRLGHEKIKDIYNDYLQTIYNTKTKRPRSKKEYEKQAIKFDLLSKYIIAIILSVFVAQAIITANFNGLLCVVINIILFIAFGFMGMLKTEEYVVEELAVWYKMQTEDHNTKANMIEQAMENFKEYLNDNNKRKEF